MSRVARDAGTVAAITVGARVIGFLRWVVFAWAVGAQGVGTVYQSVNTVPNIVYEIAAGGILAAVVVPLVAGRITAQSVGESADDVASALLTRTLAVLVPLALVLVLAAPLISRALLGDLEGRVDGAVALGTRLLVLFSPQVVLYGVGIVISGVLQAHRRFVAAALAPLLSSLVVIATYVAWALMVPAGTGPEEVGTREWLLLGGGTTLGVVAMSVPLLVVATAAGIRLRPRLRLSQEIGARARSLAGAGVLALVAQQVTVLVTLAVANRSGGDGALVVQNYVQALYLLPYAVLAVPVATAVFPLLASSATGSPEVQASAASTLAASLRAVIVLGAAAVAGLIAAASPIGDVFAEIDRGSEGAHALEAMPSALIAMAPGLVAFGVTAVALRALYARGRPLRAGAHMAAGWLVAAVIPVLTLGDDSGARRTLVTLGLASTIGMGVAAVGLLSRVRADWGPGALSGLARAAVLAAAAVALGLLVHALARGHWPDAAAAATLLGAVVALGVAALVLLIGLRLDPALRGRVPGLRRAGRTRG